VRQQPAALPVPGAVKDKPARGAGLRRHPELLQGGGARAAALRGVALAVGALVGLLGRAGAPGAGGGAGGAAGAWRSSSLVEGLNSVPRMQQARQKRLTQGLLDLKRLYWDCPRFRAGKRGGQTPYGRLGLALPEGGWWHLPKTPPEQLRGHLSALNPTA
jgi:hypothetical protein